MMTARERARFRFQVGVIIVLSWAMFVRWLETLQP